MNNVETALIKVDGLLLAEQNQLGSSGVGAAIYIDNTSTKLEKRTPAELENEKLRLEVRKLQLKVEKFKLEEEIREWNQQLQTEGDSFDSTALLGKLRVESDEKSEKIKELDEIINRIGDAVSKVLDQAKEVVQVVLPRETGRIVDQAKEVAQVVLPRETGRIVDQAKEVAQVVLPRETGRIVDQAKEVVQVVLPRETGRVVDQAKEVVQVVLPRVEKQFKRSLHDLEEGVHNLEGHIRKFF